jgi:hypothetical protein
MRALLRGCDRRWTPLTTPVAAAADGRDLVDRRGPDPDMAAVAVVVAGDSARFGEIYRL